MYIKLHFDYQKGLFSPFKQTPKANDHNEPKFKLKIGRAAWISGNDFFILKCQVISNTNIPFYFF